MGYERTGLDLEEHLLRDLIRERLGLSLAAYDGVAVITGQLAKRIQQTNCGSFLDYYRLLISDGAIARNEWREVMVALSKPKSGFWRQRRLTQTIVETALPELFSLFPAQPLRIWSAGCSSGEEPLSIAIALNQAGWFERASIEINASDGSYSAIEGAMRGIYPDQRIDQLDVQLRDRYFTQEHGGWRVAPQIQRLIQWKVANLMSEREIADLAKSHVISCRNVFIYFTDSAIRKTLALFAKHMPTGAYLFSDEGEFFNDVVSATGWFEPLESRESGVWIRRDDVFSNVI